MAAAKAFSLVACLHKHTMWCRGSVNFKCAKLWLNVKSLSHDLPTGKQCCRIKICRVDAGLLFPLRTKCEKTENRNENNRHSALVLPLLATVYSSNAAFSGVNSFTNATNMSVTLKQASYTRIVSVPALFSLYSASLLCMYGTDVVRGVRIDPPKVFLQWSEVGEGRRVRGEGGGLNMDETSHRRGLEPVENEPSPAS